jgi:hypothetical protein
MPAAVRSICLVVALSLACVALSVAGQEHDEHLGGAFIPHTEMQPPGTVVHHQMISPGEQHTVANAEQEHAEEEDNRQHEYNPDHSLNAVEMKTMAHHAGIWAAHAPEGGSLHMVCHPDDGFIHVLDSSFGQGQGTFDPKTGIIHKGDCHTHFDMTASGCQGAAQCEIIANVHAAGDVDPCPMTFKRGVVTYTCTHDEIPAHVPSTDHIPVEPFELHHFINPPSTTHFGLNLPFPSHNQFFRNFWQRQIASSFPFPDGQECEADAHRLCGGILKNCVGDFGCTSQCITDHIPNLSEGCKAKHPCYPDIDRFCNNVQGGPRNVMNCLQSNAHQLSHECTSLHPCILEAKCQEIDYDDAIIQPRRPVVQAIPLYMQMLQSARQHGHDPSTPLPFSHLILPSLVRDMEHAAKIKEHEERVGVAHDAAPVAHDAHAAAPAAPSHSSSDPEIHPDHPDSVATQHVGTFDSDDSDEDLPNEEDAGFDKTTLGTGHFTHIVLADHTDHGLDVDTRGDQPADGYPVALWSVNHQHHQLFDLNHFGQIFWIHAGQDHAHYCLAAHPTQPHQVVSELCAHESPDGHQLDVEARAQVWKYENGQIHHLASGRCVQVEGVDMGVQKGQTLSLVDCATHQPSQQFSWESGHMAETNPNIFDEHQAAVLHHRETHAEPGHMVEHHMRQEDNLPENHMPQQPEHQEAGAPMHEHLAEAALGHVMNEHVNWHVGQKAAAGDLDHRVGDLEHQVEAAEAEHTREHSIHEQEEAHLNQLDAETSADEHRLAELQSDVEALRAQESSERGQLATDEALLESERTIMSHQEEELHEDEERLTKLEHQLAEEHHAGPHEPIVLPDETHFFTPTTMILSIAFVVAAAYVFRVYLFPFFVKRFAKQTPSHYYSHSY